MNILTVYCLFKLIYGPNNLKFKFLKYYSPKGVNYNFTTVQCFIHKISKGVVIEKFQKVYHRNSV